MLLCEAAIPSFSWLCSIPVSDTITIYLSILLLMDIGVVSSLEVFCDGSVGFFGDDLSSCLDI